MQIPAAPIGWEQSALRPWISWSPTGDMTCPHVTIKHGCGLCINTHCAGFQAKREHKILLVTAVGSSLQTNKDGFSEQKWEANMVKYEELNIRRNSELCFGRKHEDDWKPNKGWPDFAIRQRSCVFLGRILLCQSNWRRKSPRTSAGHSLCLHIIHIYHWYL